jgi:hypothetical protein
MFRAGYAAERSVAFFAPFAALWVRRPASAARSRTTADE